MKNKLNAFGRKATQTFKNKTISVCFACYHVNMTLAQNLLSFIIAIALFRFTFKSTEKRCIFFCFIQTCYYKLVDWLIIIITLLNVPTIYCLHIYVVLKSMFTLVNSAVLVTNENHFCHGVIKQWHSTLPTSGCPND